MLRGARKRAFGPRKIRPLFVRTPSTPPTLMWGGGGAYLAAIVVSLWRGGVYFVDAGQCLRQLPHLRRARGGQGAAVPRMQGGHIGGAMGAAMGHGQCLWQWPCLRRARGDQGAAVPRMVGFEDPAQMTLSLEARRRCRRAPARARARELNPPSPACKLAKSRALRPYPLGGGDRPDRIETTKKKRKGRSLTNF